MLFHSISVSLIVFFATTLFFLTSGRFFNRTFCENRTIPYMMRCVRKVSSHTLWKIDTFIEKDTRFKKQCIEDNEASVPFKVGTLGPHTVLPISISSPIIVSWISLMVWNLFHFKGDFIITQARSHRAPNLGCRGTDSPESFDVLQKTSAREVIHK